MAEICSIDFATSISYSTSNTLGGLSPTVKALLGGDGQQYANARSTQQSMFAIKPEVEIWLCVGCFTFVVERTYLSMVSEKNRTDIFRNGGDIEGQTWSRGPKRYIVNNF